MGTRQFVTFRIDENLLGIPILQVREINRLLDITPIPHAPEYVRGLINLRGQTVTVFDLGIRLRLPPRRITGETHNIILKDEAVGLIVDGIGDVEETNKGDIHKPPANLGSINAAFVDGIVKLEKELLILISAERILSYDPGHKQH